MLWDDDGRNERIEALATKGLARLRAIETEALATKDLSEAVGMAVDAAADQVLRGLHREVQRVLSGGGTAEDAKAQIDAAFASARKALAQIVRLGEIKAGKAPWVTAVLNMHTRKARAGEGDDGEPLVWLREARRQSAAVGNKARDLPEPGEFIWQKANGGAGEGSGARSAGNDPPTLAELLAAREARAEALRIRDLVSLFEAAVEAVLASDVEDKPAAIRARANELTELVGKSKAIEVIISGEHVQKTLAALREA